MGAAHHQDAGLDAAWRKGYGSHVGHRGQRIVHPGRARAHHLDQHRFSQELGVALSHRAEQGQGCGQASAGHRYPKTRYPPFGVAQEPFGGFDVHGQRRDQRAVLERDEGALPEGRFAARYQGAHAQDGLALFQARSAAPNRLQAILQRRVKARHAELAGWCVFRGDGQGQDIIARQLVDQVGNAGDILRTRPPHSACLRVQDVRRRACRGHQRAIIGQGPVKTRIAPIVGKARRARVEKAQNDLPGKPDDAGLTIYVATMPGEERARLGVAHQHTHRLKDLEGCLVHSLHLLWREQLCEPDHFWVSSCDFVLSACLSPWALPRRVRRGGPYTPPLAWCPCPMTRKASGSASTTTCLSERS